MYVEHPVFESPTNKDVKVWRYMDFTKFISLLENESLYFARADKFDDPFEGSYSKQNVQNRNIIYRNTPPEIIENLSKEDIERTFMNCWNLNDCESDAMWKLYSSSNEGISIQSTFKRLTECFQKDTNYSTFIGKVKYIDYDTDYFSDENWLYPFVHKRKYFESEREIRAVIQEYYLIGKNGIDVPIDLEMLIEKIYISPTSPDWFSDRVKSIAKKYGINKDVVKSSLSDDPGF